MQYKFNKTLLFTFIYLGIVIVVSPSLINYGEATVFEKIMTALLRFPLFIYGFPENTASFLLLLIANSVIWGFILNSVFVFIKNRLTRKTKQQHFVKI